MPSILNKEPRLEFPIEAMYKNFLFTTDQQVWVGYKLDHQQFPINDLEFFKGYIEDGEGMFEHDKYDYHLVDIPNKFNLNEHVERTITELVKGDFADLGETYFRQAEEILEDEVQMNKYTTYLFVKLTNVIQVANPLEYIELIKDVSGTFVRKLTGQKQTRSVLLSSTQR